MVPRTVLTRSGLILINVVRLVNTFQSRTVVNNAGPMKNVINNAYSTTRRPFNKITTANNSNFTKKANTVKGTRVNTARPKAVLSTVKGNKGNVIKASACWVWRPKHKVLDHGNPQQDLKNKGVIESGCSRHMTRNKSYLTDYEEIDGGFVAFGYNSKGGKITRKGKIRTSKLDFEDVYFIKELKFNLFSVLQMCDKKNNVLFTDTECVVLSSDFKLTDESHVLLKVPRKDNMYSVELMNVVPQGGLTCLFTKATLDESNLWHRRLGHVNFKTMNKLVRGNLVRGLPSKLFEINQTCVACQKGKQHRASCKTKTVSSISQPLQMLHMDLFGPTFVKSLMKKMYCLVVTDDFSRFSWVFFLATKDETSKILKTFITGIENLIDLKVKVIRCDNGTEFKNKAMNQFYEMKGIKREFSVARTPQQNGVAERKNRTLIEAARTMLADSKLPTTFWAEVVNTACYVQNRVLIIKPHNKTPYELFLGKFDGKADEGFFIGYSTNSKAFRVFNSRTRIVEQFSENTSNIAGSRPNWRFDIDALTKSMNYKPVVAGNQSNSKARMEIVPSKDYILLPMWPADPLFSQDSKSSSDVPSTEEPRINQEKDDNINSTNNINTASDGNSTNNVNAISSTVNAAGTKGNVVNLKTSIELPKDPNMPELEDIVYSDDDEDVGAEADLNNLDAFMPVSHIPTTRIHKDHPVEQIIGDLHSAPQTIRMTKNLEEHGLFSSVQQRINHKYFQNCLFACFLSQEEPVKIYQMEKGLLGLNWFAGTRMMKEMDVKSVFLYGKIEEEVYVCQPLGFEDPDFPNRVYKVEKALYGLHQAPRAWYETLSTYLLDHRFQRGKIDKTLFIRRVKSDILYVGKLTFFLGLQVKQKEDEIFISQDKYVTEILKKFSFTDVKTASTPMETQKPLLKDAGGEYVEEHLYRSMIGSLMYLTSSRPDIIQVLWIQNELLDYGYNFMQTKIHIDNKSTICIVKNPVFHSKTKHIEIRHHFIRDSNEKKLIQMIKIHTDQNVADLLTKAFDVSRFQYLIASIGMLNL
ncbi:putative ribonuclease H-like domain-containing protein [Tanacetum coccineum]